LAEASCFRRAAASTSRWTHGVVLAAIGRQGVYITREDHRVKAQSGRDRCDPSKGGHDILAVSQPGPL